MDTAEIRIGIKRNAKEMLKGNYGPAIGMFALMCGLSILLSLISNIYTMNSGFIAMMEQAEFSGIAPSEVQILTGYFGLVGGITLFSSLVSFLLIVPLSFGMLHWYYQLSIGNRMGFASIFDFFSSGKKYGHSLLLCFVLGLKVFLWSLLPMIIGFGGAAALFIFAANAALPTYAVISMMILGFLLYVGAIICIIVISLRYTLVYYYGVTNPELSCKETFKLSVRHIRGHMGETFILQLSFLGWIALSIFTCGLLMFWLAPYMQATYVLYYNYLRSEGERLENASAAAQYAEPAEIQ